MKERYGGNTFVGQTPSAWAAARLLKRLLLSSLALGGYLMATENAYGEALPPAHPCLFFTAPEQARLRGLRAQGGHERIWCNIQASADWCLTRKPRTKWIAPVQPDPIYANLYDRFYAMMHDMAVAEHLAFTYAYSGDERYFQAARQWVLALCRVWATEADGAPDAGKAYAVTRLLKGIAVSYDLLWGGLSDVERREIRRVLLDLGRKYYGFFRNPATGFGPGYEPHHGSVEAASFGLVALALLPEEPEARAWLDLMVAKHRDWLLPQALVACGTHNQTSNFWISILQYRIAFLDALRRATGQDLFKEYAEFMDGSMALAATAGRGHAPDRYPETNQSWLFGPSYGQIDYVAPVLTALAREYRRPIYQYLAGWDANLGAISRSRYVSTGGEWMLFGWGGYAYAWYDPAVPAHIEPGLPLAWRFIERNANPALDVNEAYARASYKPGAVCVGIRHGLLLVHGGGRPLLSEIAPGDTPVGLPAPALDERDARTEIRLRGRPDWAYQQQVVVLERPGHVRVVRRATAPMRWWCAGRPDRKEGILSWPDGATLSVAEGRLVSFEPAGYVEDLVVGMGKLKLEDPMPTTYGLAIVEPAESGLIDFDITVPAADGRGAGVEPSREPASDLLPPQLDSLLVASTGVAAALSPFVTTGSESARARTLAAVRWDDAGLTVTFDCVDTNIVAQERKRDDPDAWKDDCVEVFLDLGHTHDYQMPWYHVLVTAAGALYDERGPAKDWGTHADNGSLRAGDIAFDATGVTAAVARTTTGWQATVTIPWSNLGARPKPGDLWGFNACRSDYPAEEYTCWAPTYGPFHQFHHWGHLLFMGSAADGELCVRAGKQMAARHARLKGGSGMVNGALLFPTVDNLDLARLPTLSVWMYRSLEMVAVEFPEILGMLCDAWCYEGPREFLGARDAGSGRLELRHGFGQELVLVTAVIPEPGAVEFVARVERHPGYEGPLPEKLSAPNICLQLWRSPRLVKPGEHYADFVRRCFIVTPKGVQFLHQTQRGLLPNQPADGHAQTPIPWVQSYLRVGEPARVPQPQSSFNYSATRYSAPVIGQVSLDGKHLIALANGSAREMCQAWHNCLHNNAEWTPAGAPVLEQRWRVKIYAMENDSTKLMVRVGDDFPEVKPQP